MANIRSEQLPIEQYSDRFDLETKEFLLCLPGVSLFNVYKVMRACVNVRDLMTKSCEELSVIMESERNGKALYDSLHGSLCSSCVNTSLEARSAVMSKNKRKKQ